MSAGGPQDLIVARLEPACRMLAEARDATAAKQVADLAHAAVIYARRRQLGADAVRYATAVEIDALEMLAEFLRAGPVNRGTQGQLNGAGPGRGKTGSTKTEPPVSTAPTREELLGKGGRKTASDALAIPVLKAEEPDLYAQVRDGEISVPKARQVRARRRQAANPPPAHTPDLPVKTYRCIVADPPWPMQKSQRAPRPDQGPAVPYATMTVADIEALPVRALADAAGCHGYLWTTHRFLPDALRVFAAWGFTYHCLLTWVKPTGMTPFSWMFNTEHVLFGYAGSFVMQRPGLKVSFDAPAPRGAHSTKPDVFFERVRQFSGGPRLELFQRGPHEGFEGWGNELAG